MLFWDFSVEFISKYDYTEAERICKKMITSQSFNIKDSDKGNSRIIVARKKNNILFVNSFSPVVTLSFFENACGTRVRVNFQLMSAVKVILCIFVIVAIAFETCLINLYLQNNLASPFLMLLPPLLAVYALLLCYFGLRVMSRSTKNRIEALLCGDGGNSN